MTDPVPSPPVPADRRARGFTLLEIMVAMAILAVGAVCVLSVFAAALMLHDERMDKVRTKLVLDEARTEAQAAWEIFRPSRGHALPPPLKDLPYSRDDKITYSVEFLPVAGEPEGLDGGRRGATAVITVLRNGDRDRRRTQEVPLLRSGLSAEERRTSLTWDQERKADEEKAKDSSGKKSK